MKRNLKYAIIIKCDYRCLNFHITRKDSLREQIVTRPFAPLASCTQLQIFTCNRKLLMNAITMQPSAASFRELGLIHLGFKCFQYRELTPACVFALCAVTNNFLLRSFRASLARRSLIHSVSSGLLL